VIPTRGGGGLSREEAVILVQRIMDGSYADAEEIGVWLTAISRGTGCPDGYVSGLIFWPDDSEVTAEQVVAAAWAYEPIAL
jgi:hypothetical protein